MTKPNHWDCESCEYWDDVNGCWADCTQYCGKEDSEDDDIGDDQPDFYEWKEQKDKEIIKPKVIESKGDD